jgi:hypothetical protein
METEAKIRVMQCRRMHGNVGGMWWERRDDVVASGDGISGRHFKPPP